MTAQALLERLKAKGITVTVKGENLSLRPAAALNLEDREQALSLKPQLLDLLRPAQSAEPPPTAAHWLRLALRRGFALTVAEADGQKPNPGEVEAVYQQIVRLTDETGPAFADALTLEEARRFRLETARCPWCGGLGHDRAALDEREARA